MLNVGILLYPNVEVLDFAGPFEVFSVASELYDHTLCDVFTISEDATLIRSVNGLQVQPDFTFENNPHIDILIIPGGVGARKQIENKVALDWIRKTTITSTITFSVCSGALLLGKLGLLDNVACTTHHEVISVLQNIAPTAQVESDTRFIDNGKIMTSAGISAGIDLSLHIVKKLFGSDVKEKTVRYMEYIEK